MPCSWWLLISQLLLQSFQVTIYLLFHFNVLSFRDNRFTIKNKDQGKCSAYKNEFFVTNLLWKWTYLKKETLNVGRFSFKNDSPLDELKEFSFKLAWTYFQHNSGCVRHFSFRNFANFQNFLNFDLRNFMLLNCTDLTWSEKATLFLHSKLSLVLHVPRHKLEYICYGYPSNILFSFNFIWV